MEKRKEFRYRTGTILSFRFGAGVRVRIEAEPDGTVMAVREVRFPVDADLPMAFLWGEWVIECREYELALVDNGAERSSSLIRLSVQETPAAVQAGYSDELSGLRGCSFRNVSNIEIYPRSVGKFCITMVEPEDSQGDDQEQRALRAENAALREALEGRLSECVAALREQEAGLRGLLSEKQRELETCIARREALEAEIGTLRAQREGLA